MEDIFYVYVWYRKDNNEPFYVGKGKLNRYESLHNRNKYFINTLNKYGGYVNKIYENLSEEKALLLEEKTIKEYKDKYKITNIQPGGNKGNSGVKFSKETKLKISKSSKLQWQDPDKRKRLIEARIKGHSNPETRRKMSEAKKGRTLTESHKSKIKESINKPSVKEKIIKSKTKYKNVKVYDLKGNIVSVFENTTDAANWVSVKENKKANLSSIIGAISGKNKTSYGYRWSAEKI